MVCYCLLLYYAINNNKIVQAEYEEEGIPWSHVQFADNAEVLRLLESSTGTMQLTLSSITI
jgi:myosin heavy subunit